MEEARVWPMVGVVGPTGSGKSELALEIAERFGGEIVNCDSLQIYRHLEIGVAKTPVEERRGVPHHLLDILNPDEVFAAGEYARAGRAVLREIAGRGKLPVVAGGSGFYFRALLEGLCPGPQRDDALRPRLARREARRPGWLHQMLMRHDPASAARIHASDVQKLIRAAEVLLRSRRAMTAWFGEGREPLEGFRTLKLGLDPPRQALYARLEARSARMFERGLIQELERALAMGFPASSKAFEALGYHQAIQVIAGELDYAEAVCQTQQGTRRYAKRQWTWFRRDPEVRWLRGFGDEPGVQQAAIEAVEDFLRCGEPSIGFLRPE
jgi:tRNA dimethylallyltransferase